MFIPNISMVQKVRIFITELLKSQRLGALSKWAGERHQQNKPEREKGKKRKEGEKGQSREEKGARKQDTSENESLRLENDNCRFSLVEPIQGQEPCKNFFNIKEDLSLISFVHAWGRCGFVHFFINLLIHLKNIYSESSIC